LFKIKKPKKHEKKAEMPRETKNRELRYWLFSRKLNSKKATLKPRIINRKPNKCLRFIRYDFFLACGEGHETRHFYYSKFIPDYNQALLYSNSVHIV